MAARVSASFSPAIPAMTFPSERVYPRTSVRETQRGTPSDSSLVDHSFQLVNANPFIKLNCDSLTPGEVLFKFNSVIHQLALYGP